MTIGERIKDLRKQNGMTQADLAKRCGYTSLTSINKIELGLSGVPISVVERIANVFGVSPSYIMGWSETGVNNGIIGNQNHNNVIGVSPVGALSPIELAIVTIVKSLDENQQGEILAYATKLLSEGRK